jgi:hypothetical protein
MLTVSDLESAMNAFESAFGSATGQARIIRLARGEAFFQVAHEAQRHHWANPCQCVLTPENSCQSIP